MRFKKELLYSTTLTKQSAILDNKITYKKENPNGSSVIIMT